MMIIIIIIIIIIVYVCLHFFFESRNRPGVAQKVPGGLGFQISRHSARECGKVVSLTRRPPLPPGMFLVLIFTRGWVERSEGDMSLKNPVTPPGIDPRTFRLVAQRLNHYATPGPPNHYATPGPCMFKYMYNYTYTDTLYVNITG
jgi:hypothetical protein